MGFGLYIGFYYGFFVKNNTFSCVLLSKKIANCTFTTREMNSGVFKYFEYKHAIFKKMKSVFRPNWPNFGSFT